MKKIERLSYTNTKTKKGKLQDCFKNQIELVDIINDLIDNNNEMIDKQPEMKIEYGYVKELDGKKYKIEAIHPKNKEEKWKLSIKEQKDEKD